MLRKLMMQTVICIITSYSAVAQLSFVYPTNGMKHVERAPVITIRAPVPIEPASITSSFPNADEMGVVHLVPTITIVEDEYSNLPAEQIARRTVLGTYELSDPRTLKFRPNYLTPGTTYRVRVQGLWAKNQSAGAFPPQEITFTVMPAVPRIAWCSLDELSQINCSQEIRIRLTNEVPGGPDVARRVIELQAASDTSTTLVPVPCTVSTYDSAIVIHPEGQWPLNAVLHVHVRLSNISGDEMDNKRYTTTVRNASKMVVGAVSDNGTPVPSFITSYYNAMSRSVISGNTEYLESASDLGQGWRFVGWQSTDVQIQGTNHGWFTPQCSELSQRINVEAIVRQCTEVQLVFSVDSGGSIVVLDSLGQVVQDVLDGDTVVLTDSSPARMLVAIPNEGFSFSEWSTSGDYTVLVQAPVLCLSEDTQGSPVSKFRRLLPEITKPTVYVRPKFPQLSTTAEVYRIKAYVTDVNTEEGWDVDDAVQFTTERRYEGAVSQEYTFCVSATSCWEIIGHRTSSGEYEMYDQPKQYACASEFSANPIATVTFLARRKVIQLRVEKVLLESDDPNSLLPEQRFDPATTIIVEVRKVKNDEDYWTTLTNVVCMDGSIVYSPYNLRCGDDVKITARESVSKGQWWKGFDLRNKYVRPQAIDRENHQYRMVIDDNIAYFDATDCNGDFTGNKEIRIRGMFRQAFTVEAIALTVRIVTGKDRKDWKWEERWFDALTYKDLDPDEPSSGRQVEYIPRKGAQVKLKFSMPVSQSSIVDGSISIDSYDNVLYSNPSLTGLDFVCTSQSGNTDFIAQGIESPRIVVVWINDPESAPRLQALHAGTFELILGKRTTSLTNKPLESTTRFHIRDVEIPGYMISLHSLRFWYDGDADVWPFTNYGESYHVFLAGDVGKDKLHESEDGMRRHPDCGEQQGVSPGTCTIEYEDEQGRILYGDLLLWIQPHWMARPDLAWWYVASYDEDCKEKSNCFVNRVHDLLTLARTKVDEYGNDPSNGQDKLITDLISLATGFVSALLPIHDQDHQLGVGNYVGRGADLWGTKRSTAHIEIGNSNGRYWINPQLLVSRAVIR